MSATREVLRAVHNDYRQVLQEEGPIHAAGLAAGSIVTATLTGPYLFGGLETTVSTVGAKTLAATHNIVATGAATGLTSLSVELALTGLYGAVMKRFPNTATLFERRRYDQLKDVEAKRARFRDRLRNVWDIVGLATAAGSPGIMLRSFVRTPNEKHWPKGVKTAGVLGALNTAVGIAAGKGLTESPGWALQWAEKGWPLAILFVSPHVVSGVTKVVQKHPKGATD